MTMRLGGAYGYGITSQGESIVEPVELAEQRARRERVRIMATKNKQDAYSATPGARAAGTHDVEEPLHAGPLDALIESDRTDSDYVPDIDTKGYHAGMVRQPVVPVADRRGNVVGYRSDHPSKFAEAPTVEDLKAFHNKVESDDDWLGATVAATPVSTDEPKKARKAAAEPKTSEPKGGDEPKNGDGGDGAQ